MRSHVRHVVGTLQGRGDDPEAAAVIEAFRLARRLIHRHGLTLPKNVPHAWAKINRLGDRHFKRGSKQKRFYRALGAVRDFSRQSNIEDATAAWVIAENETYYWYGVGIGLAAARDRLRDHAENGSIAARKGRGHASASFRPKSPPAIDKRC